MSDIRKRITLIKWCEREGVTADEAIRLAKLGHMRIQAGRVSSVVRAPAALIAEWRTEPLPVPAPVVLAPVVPAMVETEPEPEERPASRYNTKPPEDECALARARSLTGEEVLCLMRDRRRLSVELSAAERRIAALRLEVERLRSMLV